MTDHAATAFGDKLVYLATPYTNYAGGHDAAFRDACRLAARLVPAGIFVYSPIAHSHVVAHFGALDKTDMGIWGLHNAAMVKRFDVLAVGQLPGWDTSAGIADEVAAFVKAGKPIYDLDPLTLLMTRRRPERPPRDRHDGPDEAAMDAERRAYLGHAAPTTPGLTGGSVRRGDDEEPPLAAATAAESALAHDKTPGQQGGSSV